MLVIIIFIIPYTKKEYIVVSENDYKIIIVFGDNQSFYHTIIVTNSKYFFLSAK